MRIGDSLASLQLRSTCLQQQVLGPGLVLRAESEHVPEVSPSDGNVLIGRPNEFTVGVSIMPEPGQFTARSNAVNYPPADGENSLHLLPAIADPGFWRGKGRATALMIAMLMPHQVAIAQNPVEHAVRSGEDPYEVAPALAGFPHDLCLGPADRPVCVTEMSMPAQPAIGEPAVDHAVLAGNDGIEGVPSVADPFPRASPVRSTRLVAVVAEPVEVAVGFHRIDD